MAIMAIIILSMADVLFCFIVTIFNNLLFNAGKNEGAIGCCLLFSRHR